MNLPNKLTITRVILIPAFVGFLLFSEQYDWCRYIALGIFFLACITDFFDGLIARKKNLVTNFGKFMDPLADKLLVCSALICFVRFDWISVWVALIIVAREFIISGFRLVAAEQGVVLAASKIAKVKTATQMMMIVALILNFDFPAWEVLSQSLIYLSLGLTVISLADYLLKNKDVVKGPI